MKLVLSKTHRNGDTNYNLFSVVRLGQISFECRNNPMIQCTLGNMCATFTLPCFEVDLKREQGMWFKECYEPYNAL